MKKIMLLCLVFICFLNTSVLATELSYTALYVGSNATYVDFDISVPVTTAVQNVKTDFENHKLDVDWFISQVKNQGRWNVKRNAQVWSDTLGI